MSATNRGAERKPGDFYATPDWCVRVLKLYHPTLCDVLDPAAGDGAIMRHFPGSIGMEIDEERARLSGATCCDALAETPWPRHVDVVMNPPYSQAEEFVQRAVIERPAGALVCALLRLNYLGSKKRNEWLRENMPDEVLVLPRRPSFTGGGTDSIEYAWFIWGFSCSSELILAAYEECLDNTPY